MKRPLVIHPFIIAIHPVLSLFAINLGQVAFHDVTRALFVVEIVAITWFILVWRITINQNLAGLFVSLIFIFSFSADPIYDYAFNLLSSIFFRRLYFTPILLGVFVLILGVFWRNRTKLNDLTRFFNFIGVILFTFPLYTTTSYYIKNYYNTPENNDYLSLMGEPPTLNPPSINKPDIYYIVLDGYSRQDSLLEFYNYDNSNFIQFLTDTGFYVADQSQANYIATRLAVPSVTNMQYLNNFVDYIDLESDTDIPLSIIGQFPKISTALRNAGYNIINISPWVDFLSIEDADFHFRGEKDTNIPRGEFESILIDQTPYPETVNRLFPLVLVNNPVKDSQVYYWNPNARGLEIEVQIFNYQFDLLSNIQEFSSPKFVYVHIMSPHQPFTFGPNGKEHWFNFPFHQKFTPEEINDINAALGNEITFLNMRLTNTIENILLNSESQPIIILQADHGLRMYHASDLKDTCLKENFTILNAIYLPGGNDDMLYPSISPVNTFRLVFDAFFGTNLGLLPDRSYFTSCFSNCMHITDVTDEVSTCSSQSIP